MRISHRLLPPQPTFPLANEYVELQDVLEPEGWFATILLWVDMIVQPLVTFVLFVLGQDRSMFSIVSTAVRTGELWWKWARYQVLRDSVRHWVLVTKLAGGPFISCNDPKYHVFVYAEAIERLRLLLSGGSGSGTHQSRRGVSASKERLEIR